MRFKQPIHQDRLAAEMQRFRLNLMMAILIILSFVLILRLAYLQFSQFKRYATLSLKNQMSIIPIAPPRGLIVDKNGEILADNVPVYVLEITPERVKNLAKTIQQLQALIPSISSEDVENFQHLKARNRSFLPSPIKLNLNQEELAIFASNQHRFPGVGIKARLMRYYPLGEMTAHLLGYVSRINLQELRQVDAVNYQATNFIGKSGIEKYYEDRLHGRVGYQQLETDASGRAQRIISKQRPVSGDKLVLSLDARIQRAAYEALKGMRGALVLLDVHTGGVLAMASAPSFDPNLFVNGISNREYQKLANASDRPLYNRAVRGLYPPASTVKPYVALSGLEKGAITSESKIYDPGWYRLPGVSHAYRDWRRGGHGIINLHRAIMVSCDTYFYQLGNKLGISAIEDLLVQFGFGQLTHIDLFEEAPGILPSPSWKRKTKGLAWYPGDTLITAIGQGFMLASPLQLANAVSALGQEGQRFRPHLLLQRIQDQGKVKEYKPLEEYPVHLKDSAHWGLVTEAMHSVISNNEGTGYRFGRDAPYSVAGKTGTAQVFGGSKYEKMREAIMPAELRDHSLFIAFAPYEKPEVAIAVLVEHDVVAATVARKVLDAYFKLYHPELHFPESPTAANGNGAMSSPTH